MLNFSPFSEVRRSLVRIESDTQLSRLGLGARPSLLSDEDLGRLGLDLCLTSVFSARALAPAFWQAGPRGSGL